MYKYLSIFIVSILFSSLFQYFVAGQALKNQILSLNISVSDILIVFLLLSNLLLFIIFFCQHKKNNND